MAVITYYKITTLMVLFSAFADVILL